MKKIFLILFSFSLLLIHSGCSDKDAPLINMENDSISQIENKDRELRYRIENVVLSKGFQNLDPKVEIKSNGKDLSLSVNLGLLETSGIDLENIILNHNTIDLYITNNTDQDTQLAVPQLNIKLRDKDIATENLRFNIINQNYKPISIKYGLSQVLNKIMADLSITASSSPIANLYKDNDNYIWDIKYEAVFDTENIDNPLVSFAVKVDANTGELIEINKDLLSAFIDDGHFLDYTKEKSILYRKEDDLNSQSLWIHHVNKEENEQIYHTKGQINSALFSPDNKHISIIENNGADTDLFILRKDNPKVYKPVLEGVPNISFARWRDRNSLLLVINDVDTSKIYEYSLRQDKAELISTLDYNLSNLQVDKNNYILSLLNKDQKNRNLYLSKDLEDFKIMDMGFAPIFLDSNTIAYIQNHEADNKDILHLYHMDEERISSDLDLNISNMSKISDNEIFLVEKNNGNNDYSAYKYNLKSEDLEFISKLNSDKVYFNDKKNLIYVDIKIPFRSNRSEILYYMNLN